MTRLTSSVGTIEHPGWTDFSVVRLVAPDTGVSEPRLAGKVAAQSAGRASVSISRAPSNGDDDTADLINAQVQALRAQGHDVNIVAEPNWQHPTLGALRAIALEHTLLDVAPLKTVVVIVPGAGAVTTITCTAIAAEMAKHDATFRALVASYAPPSL